MRPRNPPSGHEALVVDAKARQVEVVREGCRERHQLVIAVIVVDVATLDFGPMCDEFRIGHGAPR
jgi:hypothetical protein